VLQIDSSLFIALYISLRLLLSSSFFLFIFHFWAVSRLHHIIFSTIISLHIFAIFIFNIFNIFDRIGWPLLFSSITDFQLRFQLHCWLTLSFITTPCHYATLILQRQRCQRQRRWALAASAADAVSLLTRGSSLSLQSHDCTSAILSDRIGHWER